MTAPNSKKSCVLALVVGLANWLLLGLLWAQIAAHTPLVPWIQSHDLTPMVHLSLLALDLVLSTIICIPAAFLLQALRPKAVRLYVALALIPALGTTLYQLALMLSTDFPYNWFQIVAGMTIHMASLPLAAIVLGRMPFSPARA